MSNTSYDSREYAEEFGQNEDFQKFDGTKMQLTFTVPKEEDEYGDNTNIDDGDDDIKITLPAKYEVCGTCSGKGSYVNPSIDSHGITEDEWANEWDDDARNDYLTGAFDVMCNACAGKRVIPVVDEKILSNEQKKLYKRVNKYERNLRYERESDRKTRMMESGGY